MPSILKYDKHYLSKTREYAVWAAMKQRCLNENNTYFYSYGGRGITVCARWMNFRNFYEDMGKRPSDEHSLDRIDNNGNYEPTNCRWSTRSVQELNKNVLPRNTSGYTGITRYNNVWRAVINHKKKNINLGVFENLEDAISARKKAVEHYTKLNQ